MISTDNSSTLPVTTSGLMIQYFEPPIVIPADGVSRNLPTNPPIQIVTMPQVIGLVPLFPCEGDCRYGLYTADTIADDRDFQLPVFADLTDTAGYKNDYNSWLVNFPTGYNPVAASAFKIQKYVNNIWHDVYTLTDNSFGTLYTNNFCGAPLTTSTCNNFNYQGYKIDWRLVLIASGEGIYRFKVAANYTANYIFCMASPPFCLTEWSCRGGDGMVKFETENRGGRFGDVNTQGIEWSLCCNCSAGPAGTATFPIFWRDSIRFFGFFGYETAEYQRDSIKYQTGIINKIRDEAIKNFRFRSDKLPLWFHKRFYAYGLMSDKLFVSDYNINNADYNLKHFYIVADAGYEPKYNTWSRYMKAIDIKFKEGQQYVFRDRCCSTPIRTS